MEGLTGDVTLMDDGIPKLEFFFIDASLSCVLFLSFLTPLDDLVRAQKFLEETEEKVEPELRPDVLERNWNQLLALHQERDAAIHKEIERLERLQRLAEKVHREAKAADARLDEIERRIDEEAKRLDRLHPRDAKQNCDALNADLAGVEDAIKTMFSDVQLLKDGRYMQTSDLHKRVQRIHQRWMSIRTLFQSRLLDLLPSLMADSGRSSRSSLEARLFETNEHFRYLRECSEWVRSKLVNLNFTLEN